MNKGFLHASNSTQSTCLVFHDVDVVPVDYRNSYMCGSVPRHLSEKINNDTWVFSFLALSLYQTLEGNFRLTFFIWLDYINCRTLICDIKKKQTNKQTNKQTKKNLKWQTNLALNNKWIIITFWGQVQYLFF